LSSAIGNLQAGLDVAVDVHEAPFVFPIFARLIVPDFPWLVECREPRVLLECKKVPGAGAETYQKYSVPFFMLGQTQSSMN
jgi:hypothetical protein